MMQHPQAWSQANKHHAPFFQGRFGSAAQQKYNSSIQQHTLLHPAHKAALAAPIVMCRAVCCAAGLLHLDLCHAPVQQVVGWPVAPQQQ